MLSRPGWGPLDGARSAAEPRRRCRLHHALELHEGPALAVMRVIGGFLHTKDWREAHLAPLHETAPFITSLGAENRCHPLLQCGPGCPIVLPRQLFVFQLSQAE